MHELSVALEVCRLAGEHAQRAGARRILEVGLEVGDGAGIELANLEFCLDALLRDPPFHGARHCVQRVPGDVLRMTHIEVDDDRAPD